MQVVEDNRQLASCWPPMGKCTSCGIEGHRRLRAPCIAKGRRCNNCGSEGHLARVCTTKKNLYTERNRGRAKQKGKMPASRGCLTGGAGVHAQETSHQESASRDRNTGGYAVGNVVSQRPWVKETGRGDLDIGAQSNDGARVRIPDNNVGPPRTNCSQPAGRISSESRSYRE